MKILHTADWHLDSPFRSRSLEQAQYLRQELLALPGKIAALCRRQGCQVMLLSGDVFDGPYSKASLDAFRNAMEEAAIPVFIAPGNHDYAGGSSPWLQELMPGNVHVFTRPEPESVPLPEFDCRIYGAAFTGMDSPSLLAGFRADCRERWALGVLHGDPTQAASPYSPITAGQVQESGLDYLALGHIHKGGAFRAGSCLCAWPGCPMGRGYDEPGEKGVLIVTLEDAVEARFHALDTPRFFDWEAEAGVDPAQALTQLLPPVGNQDFYHISLTGECEKPDLSALARQFAQFPYLELQDRTTAPVDLWAGAGEDTLEGVYFRLLRESIEGADENTRRQILLAARLSRQILDGQEVRLP